LDQPNLKKKKRQYILDACFEKAREEKEVHAKDS